VQPLYGELKFKVADSSTALRFYPFSEKTAPGKYEIRGLVYDSSSSTYNTTLQWDAVKFPGFWYAFGGGKSTETLKIDQAASSLTASSREIQKEKLLYNTSRINQKYGVFSNVNKNVENGLEYNSTTTVFTKSTTGGYYARLGWFGEVYVAVNGKANKLARLLIDHGSNIKDKKTLKVGTIWELGEGYNLTIEALDTKTSPRQALLSFSKDGKTIDNRVVNEGEVYTYIEKSIGGESDVPVFVTYVESIFTGADGMSSFVQLRYTWLISQKVLEVKAGDKFGVFEVKEANENYVLLYNKDNTINLAQNSVQPLYGELKFKVADSSTALRFYPLFEHTILAPEVEVKASEQATSPQPTSVSTVTASSAVVSKPVRAESTETVQTTEAAKPSTTTALPTQWNWIIFAIAGLIGTGYLVLRKG
jgi:S-layer protein (TIGR01567 family)